MCFNLKPSLTVYFLLMTLLMSTLFCEAQVDSLTKKENFLLSLFPQDCMAIYHLSTNPSLKSRLDSIRNKFIVQIVTLRRKPGLASFVFEKLSESLLPDSSKYILLKVNFKYEGKNSPYSTTSDGSLNCDTLKSTFTLPLIQKITGKVLNEGLASSEFDQPISSNAVELFNSAVFLTIDSLMAFFNNDRLVSLSNEINKFLTLMFDSIENKTAELNKQFVYARKTLVNCIESEELDSNLYYGSGGQYARRGMSLLLQNVNDSLIMSSMSKSDLILNTMINMDKYVLLNNAISANIMFLKESDLKSFSHRIFREIEKMNSTVDEILYREKKSVLFSIIRRYYENYNLQQLKQLLSDHL